MKCFSSAFLTAFALGTLTLAGCNNAATTDNSATDSANNAVTSTTTTGEEKLSGKPFTVGYNQWIGSVGVFTAKEKGFFKDAGLDVQMKQFSGPADSVPPLIGGKLDASLTTADTALLLSKEASDNALFNVFITDTSYGADAVVAQKGIKSLKDLKGKTVGATRGQCNELLLQKGLQSVGLSEKDVTITNMDADTAGSAVIAGKVPAAVTWEPWITKAKNAGANVIYSTRQAQNLILDVVTTSQKTRDEKPADLRAFIAACAKGNEYALKNPQEAAKVAAKYFGSTVPESRDMMTKVKLYTTADNKRLMGTTEAPGEAIRSINEVGKFFVAQKVMDKTADAATLFSADYLP